MRGKVFTTLRRRVKAHWVEIVLATLAGAAIFFTIIFIWCSPPWLVPNPSKPESTELIKILILILGGLGGFYGLVLGNRRLKWFSDQVKIQIKRADTAQEQLFTERLGRGAGLLAHEQMEMRLVGVRVLIDLSNSSTEEQRKLILKILYGFLQGRCRYHESTLREKYNNDFEKFSTLDMEVLDINIAIKSIIEIAGALGMSGEDISFKGLDLGFVDLSGLNTDIKLNFSKAALYYTDFENSNLTNAIFRLTYTKKTDFENADCSGADFLLRADIENAEDKEDKEEVLKKIMSEIIYEDGNPPACKIVRIDDSTSPPQLLFTEIPPDPERAYTWDYDKENRRKRRKFTRSGEWVDEPMGDGS